MVFGSEVFGRSLGLDEVTGTGRFTQDGIYVLIKKRDFSPSLSAM